MITWGRPSVQLDLLKFILYKSYPCSYSESDQFNNLSKLPVSAACTF